MRTPTHTVARRAPRSESGFSLVELLVAMTLGLILVGGMISVFSGNRRTSDLNTAMTTMQENVRFAVNAIGSDIRMAGHQGCLDLNQRTVKALSNKPPTTNLQKTAVGGWVVETAATWKPVRTALEGTVLGSRTGDFAPPSGSDREAIPGTHALSLQFGGPESSAIAAGGMVDGAGLEAPSGPLPMSGTLNIRPNDQVIVSTCEAGELFIVTDVAVVDGNEVLLHAATSSNTGNTTSTFREAYGTNAGNAAQVQIMKFNTNVYYVGKTGLTNSAGDEIRALYQQSAPFNDSNNPPVELVRGIENMRVSFGIGRSGGRLRYVTADDAEYDPERIKAVKIGLLMVSEDPIASAVDNKTYVLAGQSISPSASPTDGTTYKADKRFRLAFNTTVKVRNRRAD